MTDKLIRALRLAVDACENPSHRTHHTLQQQCRFLDGLRAALLPALEDAEKQQTEAVSFEQIADKALPQPAVRLTLVKDPVYGGMHIRIWENLAGLGEGEHLLGAVEAAGVVAPTDPREWTDQQVLDFLGVALRNVDVAGTVHLSEIRQGFDFIMGRTAAPIQREN
ncbi:hypothetical protein [Pseudomonas aeruginosa]|uniref:hypothetical protein n=1 Tax=Pseudomonas aeruginosa TaxID=287 RepID=UPI001CD5000E|nr:hypothetical protein [Pseudomonas aeruginosa]